jgi:hypothetical protein
MGISYFYNSDLRRFKNGTAFYFNADMMPGEIHLMTGVIVFPDGTEMHGYECVCDEGAPDTNVYSAAGIRYPDGREVEKPSADEVEALFLKDGAEIELEIIDIFALTPAEKDALAACGEGAQAAYARGLELRAAREARGGLQVDYESAYRPDASARKAASAAVA